MTTDATRPTAFDPHQVPIYPILTVELGETGPTLNGRTVPVPEGLTPEQAAVGAVAREIHTMPGVQAVRVHARTAEDRRYRIVVDADGHVWELPDAEPARRRPPWLWPAAAACAAVVLGGGTAAVALSTRTPPTAAQASMASTVPRIGGPVGAGANLPRTPPPGYAAQATWSVALDARTDPLVTADGTIVAVDEHDDLVRLDPATGNITWTGSMPNGSSGLKLHMSTVAGDPVVATALGRTLYTWRLPARQAQAADQPPDTPRTTALPREGSVSWDGNSPLVTLPDQTAAVVTASGTQRLDIPIGTAALSADGTTVTAADNAGHWWHLRPGQQAAAPLSATPPTGGHGPPLRILPVGSAHLAAVWDTPTSQTVVLYDAATAQPRAQATVSDVDLTHAALVHQNEGPRLTLGPVLIDPTTPAVVALPATVTPTTVTAGHVYATQNRQWLDITTTGTAATTRPIATDEAPATPRGLLTTPTPLALVVADKVDHRLLYALEPG